MKTKLLSLILIAILLVAVGYYSSLDRISKRKANGWEFSTALTDKEIETTDEQFLLRRGKVDGPVYGQPNKEWLKLKSLYRPGDEIYMASFSGRMENGEIAVEGSYVLVRGDVIIFEMTTYIS